MAGLLQEFGRRKFNEAVAFCGRKGWAKGRVDEYLRGNGVMPWDKGKRSKKDRHHVDER